MKDREPQAEVKQPAAGAELSDRQTAIEALGHFRKAQEFLRQGNWGGFGEELKKTGEILLPSKRRAERRNSLSSAGRNGRIAREKGLHIEFSLV